MSEKAIYASLFKPQSPTQYFIGYKDYLKTILDKIPWETVTQIAHTILDTYSRNGTVYIIGNGGSFSTASHFLCDLAKGTKQTGKKAIKVSALDSPAIFSAYANDMSYEDVFVEQLSNLEPNDLLIGISCSGNSPNIVKAFQYAITQQTQTIALAGFKNSKLAELGDIVIEVPSVKGEYGPVEDIHTIFMHMITTYITEVFKSQT